MSVRAANAVAAGTVNIPGVFLGGNIGRGSSITSQAGSSSRQREFDNIAVRNQVFLQVTLAYSELLRSEGRRAVALQARDEAQAIAKLTADYADDRAGPICRRQPGRHRLATPRGLSKQVGGRDLDVPRPGSASS